MDWVHSRRRILCANAGSTHLSKTKKRDRPTSSSRATYVRRDVTLARAATAALRAATWVSEQWRSLDACGMDERGGGQHVASANCALGRAGAARLRGGRRASVKCHGLGLRV